MSSSSTEQLVQVTIPKMGVYVAEGTILEWRKQPRDWVEAMTAYVCTQREQAERRGGTDAFQRLQHLKAMESTFFTPATA